MKNIISENDANQVREFINQKKNEFAYDQNQYSTIEQKQKKKTPPKLIKGKVKVYRNTSRPKLINRENLDDESELNLISERMLLFLKFTFLLLILIASFIWVKKGI